MKASLLILFVAIYGAVAQSQVSVTVNADATANAGANGDASAVSSDPSILENIKTNSDRFLDAADSFVQNGLTVKGNIIEAATTAASDINNQLNTQIDANIGTGINVVNTGINAGKSIVGNATSFLPLGIVKSVADVGFGVAGSVAEVSGDVAKGVNNVVGDIVGTATDSIQKGSKAAIGIASSTNKAIVDAAKKGIDSGLSLTSKFFKNVGTTLQNAGSRVVSSSKYTPSASTSGSASGSTSGSVSGSASGSATVTVSA